MKWGRWQAPVRLHICPPPKERCECGSTRPPFTAVGLRAPAVKGERFARRLAMRYLRAFRCPDCGEVDVWDMKSGEWWRLDELDYGPAGSEPPGEWTGGLFDLLPR